ncbi:hypothetical protein EV356DRAFT_509317 [Viridothelium virens]|uniref:Uncharacterized protein n=1 Tax=Viridothelium virens TaxID=1048519 RepID=A0A6A6GWH1_VIRVR|nr:hypothetical protein EV356DRAFT_509317 [Viridothelium virens]
MASILSFMTLYFYSASNFVLYYKTARNKCVSIPKFEQIMRFRDRALGLNTRDECLRCKESELASQIRNIDGITLQPDAKAGFDKLKLSRAGVSPVEWPWNHTVVGMYAAPNFPLPELLKRAGLRVDDARTREPGFLRDRKSSTAADIDLIVQMHDNQSNFANAVSFARARTEMLHFAKANLPLPSSASEYTMLHVGNYHRLPAINDGWNYLGLQRPTSENKSGIFQGLPPLSLRCLGIGAIDRMRKLDDLFL